MDFWNVLNKFGNGWTFQLGGHLSNASLQVQTYDAVHDDSSHYLATNGLPPCPTCVGDIFEVHYQPGANDPTTDLHWIQVILDNWAATGTTKGPGVIENVVDHPVTKSPYYDSDITSADANDFLDNPSRSADFFNVSWLAELFLVSGPDPDKPGLVTVYDGVRWGWTSGSGCIFPAPLQGLQGVVEAFDFCPIPEPSTFLLVLLGAAGAWTLRRRAAA